MTRQPTPVPVLSARTELLAMVRKMRRDLDEDALARVIDDEKYRHLGWKRIGLETCRVAFNGLLELRDLRNALDAAALIHQHRPRKDQP